jgi:hypothetical protein
MEAQMSQQWELLTPEERARITESQDLLIDRLVRQREATAEGHTKWARELAVEIDDLFREKEEVERWATLGSA